MTSIKICSKCSTDNPQQANYCRRCGAKFDNSPMIESFNYVSVPHIGDSIELSWSITNADSAILNGQTMPLNHRYEVVVDKEMTWELVATKSGKKESKRIHIVPILASDKTTIPSIVTSFGTLPCLAKVLLTVLLIDIAPVISLLIISFCSSWLRYTLNLSYNEWKNFSLYTNILLWIWIVLGIIWGCYKFYHYRKK